MVNTAAATIASYYTYILASKSYGTLYVGVTNNLLRRTEQHREGTASAFTKRYRVHRLVWFEAHQFVEDAIQREKSIKRWRRQWKINLIERDNPHWQDLTIGLRAMRSPAGDRVCREMGPRDKPWDDTVGDVQTAAGRRV